MTTPNPIRKLAEEIAKELAEAEGRNLLEPLDPEWLEEHAGRWEARLRSALDQERAAWIKEGPERERILSQSLAAQMRENERLEEENAKLQALPELSQLLGELAVAREALESLLQACGMEPHGRIHHGGLVAPSLKRADLARAALSSDLGRLDWEFIRAAIHERQGEAAGAIGASLSPSPVAEAVGRVVREAERHMEAVRLCEVGGFDDSEYSLDDVSDTNLRAAVDALQAVRAGAGNAELPAKPGEEE